MSHRPAGMLSRGHVNKTRSRNTGEMFYEAYIWIARNSVARVHDCRGPVRGRVAIPPGCKPGAEERRVCAASDFAVVHGRRFAFAPVTAPEGRQRIAISTGSQPFTGIRYERADVTFRQRRDRIAVSAGSQPFPRERMRGCVIQRSAALARIASSSVQLDLLRATRPLRE